MFLSRIKQCWDYSRGYKYPFKIKIFILRVFLGLFYDNPLLNNDRINKLLQKWLNK